MNGCVAIVFEWSTAAGMDGQTGGFGEVEARRLSCVFS